MRASALLALCVGYVAITTYRAIPADFDPDVSEGAWTEPEPRAHTGVLAHNAVLQQMELVYNGTAGVRGTEDVEFDPIDGSAVIALLDEGKIIRIHPDLPETVKKPIVLASYPGSPLAVRINPANPRQLFVADHRLGLLSVDLSTGQVTILVSSDPSGVRLKFVDHLVLSPDAATIYFSDVSRKYDYAHVMADILENRPSGRVFAYTIASRELRVVADNLAFANGVALSSDGSSLFVAETARARIQRVVLSGPDAGTQSVFIENLPGAPDNLHSDGHGGVWVSFPAGRAPELKHMLASGTMRKLLLTVPESFVHKHQMRVLRFSEQTGEITAYFEDLDGKVNAQTTGVREHNGYLYAASLYHNRLTRMKLPQTESTRH